MKCESVTEMLVLASSHVSSTGHLLECVDNPMALTLGFRCTGCLEKWEVSLTVVKKAGTDLQSQLSTPEGRQSICGKLNRGEQVQ